MRTSVGMVLAIPFMLITGCADVDKQAPKNDAMISAEQELPGSTVALAAVALPTLTTTITDFTSYTYVVQAGSIGSFADYPVTRTFDRQIVSLKLYIEAGRADDIGYVGSRLVTSVLTSCSDVGTVTSEQDVTDQVTINGNTASFVLRAKENCCCKTGWGSATQSDRADALFKWVVTLRDVCGDGVCTGSETCTSCETDCGICQQPCCPPGSTCLAGDTPVTMADGSSKAIADVVKGERVLSYQPETGAFIAGDVTQTFRHPDAEGTVLVNGRLRATPNHPFFVDGVWKRADELAVGDVLTRLDSRAGGATRMMVAPVQVETLETVAGRLTTYNLEVASAHDYFAEGYLVHNKSCRICDPL